MNLSTNELQPRKQHLWSRVVGPFHPSSAARSTRRGFRRCVAKVGFLAVVLLRSLVPASLLATGALASELVDVLPLTDRIIMLHFDEGYVVHHKNGEPRSNEKVVVSELDVAKASLPASYQITSDKDSAYAQAQMPTEIGRKSKGTDFAWFADKWVDGVATNDRPDHAKEHWLYLFLPSAMKAGQTYTIATGDLATNGATFTLAYDPGKARSEAVHVNIIGYVPSAPEKFAYVSHWMGDKGSLDLKSYEGRAFHLRDADSGQVAFTGKLAFRTPASQQETATKADSPPDGNFIKADTYQCDFSSFRQAGHYTVDVEGIGCSFPFTIGDDVYREPFRTVARGLYHNRSGIELKEPFTRFTRPAPHNPKLTPGFAGKLIYTTVRFTEWGSEGGDPKALLAGSKGPIESCGWYQDAGDWDSYISHLRVAQELLTIYEMAPKNFTDGELNIPESGNGIPDILDEAAWLPRFCYRLRHELLDKKYATGGIGLRIAGDSFGGDEGTKDGKNVGQGSWEDVNRTWAASGEDPFSTYRYAGAAAHLAYCLQIAGKADPEGVNWTKEARESFDWAGRNTREGDEEKGLLNHRIYAAAALFRLTGEKAYEQQFIKDTTGIQPTTQLWDDAHFGPMVYALSGSSANPDPAVHQRIRAALLATADATVDTASKRAMRWGGNFSMPMLIGQQTTPWTLETAVGYELAKKQDPERAKKYLSALYTTCDYFLGGNSMNMTWATGLGMRHPNHVFHLDAWYNGKDVFHPGIIPYGPWRKQKDLGQGPWDQDWPNKTLYPAIDEWPGNERWFDNRCSPLTGEFTVHQNAAPAAAAFGFLCAPGPQQ